MDKEELVIFWEDLESLLASENFLHKCNQFLKLQGVEYTLDEIVNNNFNMNYDLNLVYDPIIKNEKFVSTITDYLENSISDTTVNYNNLFDLTFFIYAISYSQLNYNILHKGQLIPLLIQLVDNFIKKSTNINEFELIILQNTYKTLNCFCPYLKESEKLKSLLSKSLKFVGSIQFSNHAYQITITLIELISNVFHLILISPTKSEIISSVLEKLLHFIGWPQENILNKWKLNDDQQKFDFQMKVLDTISACFIYESNVKFWSTIGGFQKIMDFIFWTTITFPYQDINNTSLSKHQKDSNLDPLSKPEPSSWNIINRNLKHLFDTLFSMCLQSMENSNSFLVTSIISLVMDLFNDSKRYSNENTLARKFIKDIPELQLNSLSMLSYFQSMFPLIIGDYSVPLWKILEREEYFLSQSKRTSSSNNQNSNFDRASDYLNYMLEIQYFQYLSITSMSESNDGQIEFILKSMQSYCDIGMINYLFRCSYCLLLITLHNEQLLKSCSTNYIMNNLIMIINQHSHICSTSSTSDDERLKQIESNLLQSLLNCAEISIVKDGAKEILEDYNLMKKLFSMATEKWRYDIISSYIMPIIVQLILSFDSNLTKNHYRFFNCFSKLITKSQSNLELLILVLDNITETLTVQRVDDIHFESHLKNEIKIRQKAFLKSKVISRISSAISNVDLNSEKASDFILSTLKCLTSLFKNNMKAKVIFKKDLGFNKLEELLLQLHNGCNKTRKRLIVRLFDMCLDSNYRIEFGENSEGLSLNIKTFSNKQIQYPIIANPEIISILISIIEQFDLIEKNFILKTIYNIISDSITNKKKCMNENICELCIEKIRTLKDMSYSEYIFEILFQLGSFSMSVIQLKKLLQLFDPLTHDIRPIHTPFVFGLLERLLVEQPKDHLSYMNFDGINSGLKIPKFKQWPTHNKGNSICANIRLESYANPITYEPLPQVLFSVVDENGKGFQLYFEQPYLVFESYHESDIGYVKKMFDIMFDEKQWYFITFSFGVENGILGKFTKLNLFVITEKNEFKSSRIIINSCLSFQALKKCYIGNISSLYSLHREEQSLLKPFNGQISDFLIVEDYIFKDKFKELFLNDLIRSEIYSKLLTHTPQENLILHYSSLPMEENETEICYDLSIHNNTGILCYNTFIVHRITPLESLFCLSGDIYTLYPLLFLIDMYDSKEQKELFENAINADEVTSAKILNDIYAFDHDNYLAHIEKGSHALFETISLLILNLIIKDKFKEIQIYFDERVPILTYLILKLSPRNISKNFLFALMDFITSDETPIKIKESILDYMILDFHLWSYTDFDIQIQLVDVVIPQILKLNPPFYNFITVKRLLENIQTFYWTVASHDSMASNNILHPVLKHVVSQRPTADELLHIRNHMYDIMYDLALRNFDLEDSKSIINIIIHCNDPILIGEYYTFVIRLLENEAIGKTVANHFIMLGYELFTLPLKNKIYSIREQTIHFLCDLQNYLTGCMIPRQLIYEHLKTKLNDNRVYKSLFSAATGLSYNRQSINPQSTETSRIMHPQIILVALQLCKIDKEEYRYEFLNELLQLMCSHEANIQALSTIHLWEMHIISLLSTETNNPNLKISINLAVTNIFISYILYKIKTEKNCVSYLLDLLCWYNIFLGEDDSYQNVLFQEVLKGILDPIIFDLKKLINNDTTNLDILINSKDKEDPIISNIIQLVLFISDYCMLSMKLSDVFVSSQSVVNSGLLQQLSEIIFLMDGLFNINVSTSSSLSFKKGSFKCSNGIPLLFKISFIQIYSLIDLDVIQLSINNMWSYIKNRDIKKDEIFYVTFHTINAITLKIMFRTQFNISNEEKESILKLLSILLQFISNLFKSFNNLFMGLKKLDDEMKTYMVEIMESPSPQKFISQPNQLENMLYVLKNYIVADKVNTYISAYIKKNLKLFENMFTQQLNNDSELILKTKKELETKEEQLNNRIISKQKLKLHYSYISRLWTKIERLLKDEGGIWGYGKVKKYWKLSNRENHLRMRMCFKENTNFNDHSDALKGAISDPKNKSKKLAPSLSSGDLLAKGRPDLNIDQEDFKVLIDANLTIDSYNCELIRPLKVTPGIFEITEENLQFKEIELNISSMNVFTYKIIPINQIKHIYTRRYKLQATAIEIFLTNNKSYFFNFNEKPKKIYDKIKSLNPPNLEKEMPKEELMKEWLKGSISNFEYLMELNTLAGRTYNDLSQYPIFPWVLVDFESETINLNNPKIYRDLSKPIGALNEKLLELYKNKSEELPQDERYLYPIYYSNPSIVLYYLLRVEPFTTHSITLHDNKFDHPDRMFYSFHRALSNSFESLGDIKELIPEFFYLPESLENMNNFSFGVRQNGKILHHVELPPWAKTPEEFIKIHRKALESDYVSSNLHNWIDLIFGYKQKGEAAVEANNTFHPYLYAENINLDDPKTKRFALSMSRECGQVPLQLFNYKHPSKKVQQKLTPIIPSQPKIIALSKHSLIWTSIAMKKDTIISIDNLGEVILCKSESNIITNESRKNVIQFGYLDRYRIIHKSIPNETFALSYDGNNLYSIRANYGFSNIDLEIDEVIQNINVNKKATSICLTERGKNLIVGYKDSSIFVWKVEHKNSTNYVSKEPIARLSGHENPIRSIVANERLGVCLSLSTRNSCLMHWINGNIPIRSIGHEDSTIHQMFLSIQGFILLFSKPSTFYLYTINGKFLNTFKTEENPIITIVTDDGEYIITGGDNVVIIRRLFNFEIVKVINIKGTVISMSSNERYIVAGLKEGKCYLFNFNVN